MTQALDLSWTIPTTGQMLAGKYHVEAQCGVGGLAVVLSAIQIGLDRRVAIKLLLPHWAHHPEVVERFLREGRAATRIKSEHVVRVFDVGRLENGAPFLVLEYLEGNDLDEVLRQWGPLPVSTAIDWVSQAMEAIAEAHTHGIVHRDLKPANLFLTQRSDGTASVKVIDFGLSKIADPGARLDPNKLTRPTDVMGSPHYMAPEQLRATCEADARTDIWALGAVLHELIAGRPPFQGTTMAELCAAVLTQPPEPLSAVRAGVPLAIEQAVLRCLEKDPAARFANVAEFALAISAHGSSAARASCERIERMAGLSPRPRDVPSLPPLVYDRASEWTPIPPELPRTRPPGEAPSARIILGSLLILSAIGAASLMGMYSSVHAHDPPHAQPATSPARPAEGRAMIQPPPAGPVEATQLAPLKAPPVQAPDAPVLAPPAAPALPSQAGPHDGPTVRPRRAPATPTVRPPRKAVHARQAPREAPPPSPDDDSQTDDRTTLPATSEPSGAAPPAPSDDRAFDERQ
jgi:serine/threonine-protein kinase